MSITFERFEPYIIHMTWTEKITYEDVKAAMQARFDYSASLNELPAVIVIDTRQAHLPSINLPKLREIFRIQKARGGTAGIVLIGTSTIAKLGGQILVSVFQQNIAFADTLEAAFKVARAMRDAYFVKHSSPNRLQAEPQEEN